MLRSLSAGILLATVAFSSPAFAQGGHDGHGGAQSSQSSQSPFAKEAMAKMMAMHDDMMDMSKTNGNADHDFLVMMIPHHQGAIDMAEVYLKYSKDEKVKKLARKVIADQKKEIAQMEQWLEQGVGAKK